MLRGTGDPSDGAAARRMTARTTLPASHPGGTGRGLPGASSGVVTRPPDARWKVTCRFAPRMPRRWRSERGQRNGDNSPLW